MNMWVREIVMKLRFASVVAIATASFIVPAKAQVVLDLSLITCKQLLDSDAERQALIGSWLSGYFSASKNLNVLELPLCRTEHKGRRQLLQNAQVRYRDERDAEELALASSTWSLDSFTLGPVRLLQRRTVQMLKRSDHLEHD